MPGFVGVISNDVDYDSLRIEYDCLGELVIDRKQYDNALVERYTIPKFLEDKVFREDKEVFVLIEGVILNFRDLKNKYASTDYFSTVKNMYRENGDDFFSEFKGEFSGVLYDRINKKWLVFTNPTSSKPVYFYRGNGLCIFSSELKVISQILRRLNCKYSLDILGAYFLLTYGFMLADYTLIEEVKKLRPGAYVKVENDKVGFLEYVKFEGGQYINSSKEQIIDNLDTLFKEAVRLEYEKDLEYGYKHIATLSGGLDTRMNVMTAHELGYQDILCFTLAQSNYYDERIAKKITSDLGCEFLFYSLDNGNYLRNVREPVLCNDGMVLYSGSAHLLSCIEKINLDQFGAMHTGMLGDAVLGTYLSKPKPTRPMAKTGAYSLYLIERILPKIEAEIEHYEFEELFKLYNRGFNGILNGNWTISQFTECVSPFLDVEFMKYCFSIPPSMRYKEKIYIEWILSRHPDAAKYVWEATKLRPSTNRIFPFIVKVIRRLYIKAFGKTNLLSMNPFQYWYKTNSDLRLFVNDYFQKNLYLLDDYYQLKKDCIRLFNRGTLLEKTQVMTLMAAIKLHFG
ncbi:MAG: asparagine synthase-related protein [Planctomycetota bacterium]|jgi:asparagine synthase (glutamine-hydrolysing)